MRSGLMQPFTETELNDMPAERVDALRMVQDCVSAIDRANAEGS